MRQGDIKSPFEPAPTPTRTSNSYALEGDAQFTAGSLDNAIAAYREAVRVDPSNAEAWAELARIQAYSSTLLTTDAEIKARLNDSLVSAQKAVALARMTARPTPSWLLRSTGMPPPPSLIAPKSRTS